MTDKPPLLPPIITRRDLLQRACFASAWAAFAPLAAKARASENGLTPAQQGIDASDEFSNPNWKPLFFSDEQNLTIVALGEAILPATETPGAKQAMVNRYVDLVLFAEPADVQSAFVKSVKYIDDESLRVYRKLFHALSSEEQVELLIPMAYLMQRAPETYSPQVDPGYEHFARVKALIVEGYYSSEIGDSELGWDGAFSHGAYFGCEAEEKK